VGQTTNPSTNRGHRFTLERYSGDWNQILHCTLCGHTEAGDGAGHRVALDREWQIIQPAREMAARLLAPCPNPARSVTKFTVSTDIDLDHFKVAAILVLTSANPLGWPIIRIGFTDLMGLSRTVLRVDPHPVNYYLVETDTEVIWEEDDRFDDTRTITMRIRREAGASARFAQT